MAETTKERLNKQFAQLESERQSFEPHWRELSDYINPRGSRFLTSEVNRNDRRNTRIIDSTGTMAARTLASGMMSGITSPARPWFRLATPDPEMMDYGPVKLWLEAVQNRMNDMFNKSNLYQSLPQLYGSLGTYSTGAMAVLEDDEDIIRTMPFPIGSYYLANSPRGSVDTCFRKFSMTVRQLVQEFGLNNVSESVKSMWESGTYEKWIEVMHSVYPNIDRDTSKLDSKNKPFKSVYYEVGGDNDKLLRESGFDEFPIMAPRWEVNGEDVYGSSCPGMLALGPVGDDWDIGLHVYDSSDAVIDNVQVVGYWRVKGVLLTENDGSLSMKGNPEKTHFNNLYVQSGIGVRNSPQIDLVSNTTDSVTFLHRPSLRITAGNSFAIAGSADLRTFTGSTFDGTNVTLTGVTPPISGTIGVIRFPGLGNNFSGTVFENTVATTLDHTSGQPAESFGLPPSFALEVDGYPIRNLRFDKFKAQTTFDKGNTLWGDCRDTKLTSSEFENGRMVGYNLSQTQGYTGNMRWFACDLQSNVDTTAFTPRDAFVDNRQIKTDFTDGSFILKNWRPTNTRVQWSTGQDAFVMREAPTEASVGGLYGYTLDGLRWLTVDGPTKDITLLSRNGSINNSADNSSVINWFGTSGNVSFKGVIAPMVDNSKSCGSASFRWSQVYAATGTINTSDEREKSKPVPITDAVLDAWGDVSVIAFQWLSMIAEKGASARWHFGVIAQQVRDAFESHGIDGTKFGLLCYDEWDDVYEPVTEIRDVVIREEVSEGEWVERIVKETHETGEQRLVLAAGNRWGVRPDQCAWLEAAYQRRRCDRIEERLEILESK